MPSPFPGMDPWLEDPEVFPNLHEKLAVYLSEALNSEMPAGYVATIKNRVWIDEDRLREPDVSLYGRDREARGGTATLPDMLAVGPELATDPLEEPYIEILSSHGKRLIAAVEIISLSNKRAGPKGRKAYQSKQKEYRRAGVHLVEIDLLRAGPHVTAVPLRRLNAVAGRFDYHASVRLMGDSIQLFVGPMKLTERLPRIAIPLGHSVKPVLIELQPLLDRAYDTGRYPELVRYDQPCEPPLTGEQQKWADAILRTKGLLK